MLLHTYLFLSKYQKKVFQVGPLQQRKSLYLGLKKHKRSENYVQNCIFPFFLQDSKQFINYWERRKIKDMFTNKQAQKAQYVVHGSCD